MHNSYRVITDQKLAELSNREIALYESRTPKSCQLFKDAQKMLLNGVPMPWMGDWGTRYPMFVDCASGNRVIDVDGNGYIDFCLGDTGAMFGHSPEPTVLAVNEQIRRGITTMLPSEDALAVGRDLSARFGVPYWQFAMTATEANRYVIRIARVLTGRPKTLAFNECYHGSVEETLPHIAKDGSLTLRSEYDINPAVPKNAITRMVEFNDVAALEHELEYEDVACVVAEPVMTNCGMVLPAPGYHEKLRELCDKYGTLLVIDETHTFSTSWGGYTHAYGLKPDFVTLGKSIAGGIPVAAYGFTEEIKRRINTSFGRKGVADPMGIGGTLSGNALAIHAMRRTLEEVATPQAFDRMISAANRMADGLEASIKQHGVPWSVTRCGARAELQFMPAPPANGGEAKANFHWDLIYYTHLFLANRGLLITPFHNMMLVPPMATDEDIDILVTHWDAIMEEMSALAGVLE